MEHKANEDWLDLQAVVRIVRRRFMTVLLVSAIVLAASLLGIVGMERSYSAQARLLMHDPLSADLTARGSSSESRLNLSNEIERILSRDVAVRVIQELELDETPELNSTLQELSLRQQAIAAVKDFVQTEPDDEGEAEDEDVEEIQLVIPEYFARLSVFRREGSDVLNIGFTSLDAAVAAAVPNALIRVYLEERERQYRSRVDETVAWLAERIDEQRKRVADADQVVTARRNEQDLSSPTALGVAEEISGLSERRIAIRQELAATRAQLEEMRSPGASGTEIVETVRMKDLRLDLQMANLALKRLLEDYGENNRQVVALREDIEEIRNRIQFEVNFNEQQLDNRVAALRKEAANNLEELEGARGALAIAKSAEAQLSTFERAEKREEELLNSLEQQRRNLLSDAERPFTEVEVLAPAAVPLAPNGRGKAFYLVAAMLGAGVLGVTVAFGREMLDRSIRSSEHLQHMDQISGTGLVPRVGWSWAAPSGPAWFLRPAGVFADAIRGVALFIEQHAGGTMPRSLLVTSALPREGKTTIAAALAAELAGSQQSVLLVDADLRRGQIHNLFGVEPFPGLSDYLSGASTLSEVVRHDVATGIDFIGRGVTDSIPQLDRRKIGALIQSANSAGQTVILDSPPALATIDTPILAGLVESTLLVAKWGRTGRDAVEAAVQRLAPSSQSEILAVINRVNLRRQALYGFRDAGPFASTFRSFHRKRA